MICDGSAISRTDYAGLFAAIGSAWGSGDGSTTFHLPDLRGRFLRGVDNDQGRDPDRASRTAANSGGNTGDAVGSIQGHAFQTHNHTHDTGGNNATGTFHQSSVSAEASFIFTGSTGASGTHAQPSANETRPVNANVNFIIKV
jgi:microcystin-dependent protein